MGRNPEILGPEIDPFSSSGHLRHVLAGVNRRKLMALGNSNTLLILSLQLTKIATVCKRTIPQRLSSKVPEVRVEPGQDTEWI